jgi:hypothetical protein
VSNLKAHGFTVGPPEKVHPANATTFFAKHGIIQVIRILDKLLGEALAKEKATAPKSSRFRRLLAAPRPDKKSKGDGGGSGDQPRTGTVTETALALADIIKRWFSEEIVGLLHHHRDVGERFHAVRAAQLVVSGNGDDSGTVDLETRSMPGPRRSASTGSTAFNLSLRSVRIGADDSSMRSWR